VIGVNGRNAAMEVLRAGRRGGGAAGRGKSGWW
jgi:hypothetical protein